MAGCQRIAPASIAVVHCAIDDQRVVDRWTSKSTGSMGPRSAAMYKDTRILFSAILLEFVGMYHIRTHR